MVAAARVAPGVACTPICFLACSEFPEFVATPVGADRGNQGTDVTCPHASLHLHDVRHAVFALRGSARCLSDLHRRAAVRPSIGPVLDHAGGVTERAQQQVPPPRDGAYDHRDHPSVRHRAARHSSAHAGRQRAVGLHRPDRRRHSRSAEGPGRRHGDRDLPPPLLHHDGGVEPRPRGSADLPARG